ncbi:hypothetical protein KKJ09_10170 [Xenorhabdus bovienii]|nr:hypothetical protein [Xenorhabdus bovienii]MDE9493948.1 hypothetical protein [Xenorhabdus bovienii]MDE9502484.1 hypothetical protein [Xenorhabdus bovienii]MDE9524957.1 hypothetical protein [Xenorhabdus bovienii]MDE9567667.1 hypothetical protein [Xenorhabdus bovienii]
MRCPGSLNHYSYQQNGFSRQEARVLVSMDLGHGDGRWRYVERVYNQGGLE